jgi:hypothetical protein
MLGCGVEEHPGLLRRPDRDDWSHSGAVPDGDPFVGPDHGPDRSSAGELDVRSGLTGRSLRLIALLSADIRVACTRLMLVAPIRRTGPLAVRTARMRVSSSGTVSSGSERPTSGSTA